MAALHLWMCSCGYDGTIHSPYKLRGEDGPIPLFYGNVPSIVVWYCPLVKVRERAELALSACTSCA